MQKYIILFALFGAVLAGSVGKRVSLDREQTLHPTFDCKNPADHDQLFNNPDDCTRFIQCDNGRAWDKPCALCDGNNYQCAGETYTHFDRSVNDTACIWPVDSNCKGDPAPTTTQRPTTTTEGSTTTLQPGDWCDAECQVEGDCSGYRFCKRDSDDPSNNNGTWTSGKCPTGLYFERRPARPVATCVKWDDLNEETRNEYLQDENCTYCEVIPLGDCEEQYKFRDDKGVTSVETCSPAGHVFDVSRHACVPAGECSA